MKIFVVAGAIAIMCGNMKTFIRLFHSSLISPHQLILFVRSKNT